MREGLIGFVLFLLLFSPFYFRGAAPVSFATQDNLASPAASPKDGLSVPVAQPPTAIPTADTAAVDYSLPYPGILPDHPLYFLKVLRDRILDKLIRDPQRKVEYYLLMADKRLNMGIYLENKEKPQLAETTVSKGEKYFAKGTALLERLISEGKISSTSELLGEYRKAARKHEQVIISLKKDAPENIKSGYQTSIQLLSEQTGRLDKIQ